MSQPVNSVTINGVQMPSPERIAALEHVLHCAKRVRQCQKQYFRTKDIADLKVSKDWERRLDDAITACEPGQNLFDQINGSGS